LCSYHHRDSKEGVHGNRKLDLKLKIECQEKFEETNSHEDFMKIIKRDYVHLKEDDKK
jgi:hypothetical protein